MNTIHVNNGKAEIKADGKTIGVVGHGEIIAAEYSPDHTLILCVTDQGNVELRKENGSVQKNLASNAVYATYDGGNVLVTTMKGKLELRKENGSLIKVLA